MLLLPLIRRVQENDENAMMEILQMFEPKIKKSLNVVHIDRREDYRQEVYIRIIKAVRRYDLNAAPDILEFISRLSNRQSEKEAS
ncbi:helix-turn-helix domain-containing protein [uncultured Brevibacillus sp.]|uniref:helix-turn-helix domain-containing protein n=1 Tax=uncultured Brevibacillus sp. TaxID=169970 RepID=UPI002596D55C|nr:helix-turn-helix domain-containing protein [uncultured Brevibacillus sp.]